MQMHIPNFARNQFNDLRNVNMAQEMFVQLGSAGRNRRAKRLMDQGFVSMGIDKRVRDLPHSRFTNWFNEGGTRLNLKMSGDKEGQLQYANAAVRGLPEGEGTLSSHEMDLAGIRAKLIAEGKKRASYTATGTIGATLLPAEYEANKHYNQRTTRQL